MEAEVQERGKISEAPNERPITESIAGTGPGIPDEALAPGEELLEPPSDEEVDRTAKALGAQQGGANPGEKPWWRSRGAAAAAGIGSAAIVTALLYAGRSRRS